MRDERRRSLILSLPVVLTLLLSLLLSWRPAFWLDEAVTLNVTRLTWPDLADSLGRIDAVHAAYYAMLKVWSAAFGDEAFMLRAPSAVFMALACAATVRVADSLAGFRVAVASGFSFAFLPVVSKYGMEARSYALVTALVAWACYWFVTAVEGRGSWVGYGALMALAGLVFLYALLVLAAHAVTLWLSKASRETWRRFTLSAALAVLAALPLLILASRQRSQIAWLTPTDLATVLRAPFVWVVSASGLPQTLALGAAVWGVILFGLLQAYRSRQSPTRDARQLTVPALAVPWLLLPLVMLILASLVTPLFAPRYVLFSAPALALLVGLGLSQIRRRGALVVVSGMLLLFAMPALASDRSPSGRDFWGDKQAIVLREGQPGDAVIVTPIYYLAVVDTGLGPQFVRIQAPVSPGHPAFWDAPSGDVLLERLDDVERVWLIPFDDQAAPEDAQRYRALLEEEFVPVQTFSAGNATVTLFVRRDE